MPVPAEIVQFEPNRGCNLRCPICPATVKGLHRDQAEVEPEAYRDIVGRSFLPPYLLILSGFSETLLHEELEQIISFEKGRGCRVAVATNGLLLDPERASRLLEAGVDQFTVSIDSCSPELFARIRAGAELENVIENTANLVATIRNGGYRCSVTVNAVVTRKTAAGMVELLDMLSGMGVKEFALIKLMKTPGKENASVTGQWLDWKSYRKAVDWKGLEALARERGLSVMVSSGEKLSAEGCRLPSKSFYISSGFDLSFCPMLGHGHGIVFGNLLKDTIENIVSSATYHEMAALAASGKLAECSDCACLFDYI